MDAATAKFFRLIYGPGIKDMLSGTSLHKFLLVYSGIENLIFSI